jgi:outer membrane lipoprotein LolB
LSVRIDATAMQSSRSFSAGFDLRGTGDSGELQLNSPLGTRMADARWAPGVAVLSTADGERHFDSLDELSRLALGEAVPLAALPDWLAGHPWPGAPHRMLDGGFEQLGWRVQLARLAEGWLEARREAPPVVAVRVKINGAQP